MSETLVVDKLVYEVGQKPCPLCGGDKLVKHDTCAHLEKYNGGYGIQCTDCGCSASIKSWNNRTSEPALVDLEKCAIAASHWYRNIYYPIPQWGDLGPAARHAYLEQVKMILDAAGVPYAD